MVMLSRYEIILFLTWGLISQGPDLTRASWPEKIAQQYGNVLVDFFAYRHVSIVHFDVPENAVSVGFKFTVKEEKTGGIGDCSPRDVTINLKSGSLPLVTPDGSRIEAKLLENRRRYYTVGALSNGDEHIVNIVAPPPGDWYVIAYRSWFDPNSGKIKQQGLGASCDTVLDAELSVEFADQIFPMSESRNEYAVMLTGSEESCVMQFHVPKRTERSKVKIESTCGEGCAIALHLTASDHLSGHVVNLTKSSFELRPYDGESIHYVTMQLVSGPGSNLTVLWENEPENPDNFTDVKLTRKTLPDFFLFDYEHLLGNGTKSAPFNLTAGSLSVLRFKVGPVYDTGGTLSVGLRFATEDKDAKDNVVLVGCLNLGFYSGITEDGRCKREGSISGPDVFVANRSTPGFVHVPFPEPGIWHLSLRAYCLIEDEQQVDEDEEISTTSIATTSKCECFEECARNATNCEECRCMRECDARVESSVASSPCIEGECTSHGRCVHYMSGGFVFSACHCYGGYQGFDCADDRYVLSRADLLARLLVLTLSNLAFVGAIYVAIARFYYTEAIVYAAVMFFSTFYHACEAGEEAHSFCLMKLSVLQFCDFYNALLSIWVTLVAMASLGARATSFCHMLGVVVLAVGAEMDRTALWVFLLPAISGCTLVVASWPFKCRKKGTFQYPARIYRLFYLPIGLIVVFIGLICYAFLQTKRNYYIVHSIWHICVAAGVVLLLPKREYMK